MGVSSFVAELEPYPNFLVVWVGFFHVVLVLTCLGYAILGGINVLMVVPQDHWNHVIINALVRCVVFGLSSGVSSGASGWHPESPTLYFHFFYSFPPLVFTNGGSGKRQSVTPVHLLDGSNLGRRVPLTRKTRPGALFSPDPDPGHPTPRR